MLFKTIGFASLTNNLTVTIKVDRYKLERFQC